MTPKSTLPEPRLISCIGVDSDLPMLPHFLRHYRALGVLPDRMHLILHASDPASPALASAREVLADFGVVPGEIWTAPYTSDAMWARRRAMQAAHAARDDWVLSADADEFHVYPEPLGPFLARLDRMGVTCTQGPFIDRLGPDGRLAPVRPAPEIWQQFPVEAEAIWSLSRRGVYHGRHGTVKLMAIKGHVMPARGGHNPQYGQPGLRHLYGGPLEVPKSVTHPWIRFALPLQVHHFHWTAALEASLRRRLATPGVSMAGQEYGTKVLAHIEAHGGIALEHLALKKAQRGSRIPWRWRAALLRPPLRARYFASQLRAKLRAPARARADDAARDDSEEPHGSAERSDKGTAYSPPLARASIRQSGPSPEESDSQAGARMRADREESEGCRSEPETVSRPETRNKEQGI